MLLRPAIAAGFSLLGETENADVKRARGFFAARGDRDLDVIETKDWHRVMIGSGPPPAQGETQK